MFEMRSMPDTWFAACAATLLTLGVSAPATAASFQGLGDLSGGAFSSAATAVSADGTTVVGAGTSAAGTEPFRWTAGGGMASLGHFTGSSGGGTALGVSADGGTVVGRSTVTLMDSWGNYRQQVDHAFIWTAQDGMQRLGTADSTSEATGVSADGGVVVGGGNFGPGNDAFYWTPLYGFTSLGHLPSSPHSASASGISADGTVVVGTSSSSAPGGAFRWVYPGTGSGVMSNLGALPGGTISAAHAVSADGTTVVGSADAASGAFHAFRWTATGGMVALANRPGRQSDALSVSADGSVVVGYDLDSSWNMEAIVWDGSAGPRSLTDILTHDLGLDLTGWTLEIATDISDDGTVIVGSGINPLGQNEAWIASLAVPEPTSVSLFASLLPLLAVIRRRRTP